jgi:hypothetical protein
LLPAALPGGLRNCPPRLIVWGIFLPFVEENLGGEVEKIRKI